MQNLYDNRDDISRMSYRLDDSRDEHIEVRNNEFIYYDYNDGLSLTGENQSLTRLQSVEGDNVMSFLDIDNLNQLRWEIP